MRHKIIYSYISSSYSTKERDVIFEHSDGTRANLILLKDHYLGLEIKEFIKEHKLNYNKVRGGSKYKMLKFLTQVSQKLFVKAQKELFCTYCGKSLIKSNKNNEDRVTVDHIIAKFNGGSLLDWYNYVIACNKCNSEKSDCDNLIDKKLKKSKQKFNPLNKKYLEQINNL